MKILSKKKVQAKVFDELPDEHVFAVSAIENGFHKGFSATEWALYLEKWKKITGLTNKQIAEFLGVEREEISNYLRLLTLPDVFKKLPLSLNIGLQILKIKDTEKQLAIGKELNKVYKKNLHMPRHRLDKEFTKTMKKHLSKYVKKTPIEHLKKMLFEDLDDMMKREKRTREAFAKYFLDACLKTELYQQYYNKAWDFIYRATKKSPQQIVDISLEISFVKGELVVDVDGYRDKDSGKWIPFELRFKSYRL